jgi:hypothetical protein
MIAKIKISAAKFEPCLACLLIGLVGLLNYAPLLNQLGFYKEDWYIIWAGVTQDISFLVELFAGERPVVGYLYRILYPFLGNQPLPWHIYALSIRLLGAFAFFWLLRMLWPRQPMFTTITTLFFVSYPGFLQQAQANTFQFLLTSLTLAVFSIALTIYSTQARSKALCITAIFLSAVTGLAYPLVIEHYIGIEGLRLLLLAYALRRRSGKPWRELLPAFAGRILPVVFAAMLFLFWRAFLFESTRHTTDIGEMLSAYQGNTLFLLARFGLELARDTLETLFLAWFVPLERFLYWGGLSTIVTALLLALLVAAITWIYLRYVNHPTPIQPGAQDQDFKHLVWIATLGTILALVPVIAALQDVRFELFTRLDRFTVPAIPSAALFTGALVFSIFKSKYRPTVSLFLLALAVMAHFNYSTYMRDFWEVQRQIWWQLSWRAPSLQPETTLLVNLPDNFNFAEGYEAWAPANLIYFHQPGDPPITAEAFLSNTIYELMRGDEKARNYRNMRLKRNFKNALIISLPSKNACLNVIDGRKYELTQLEPPFVREAAPYSNIDRIVTNTEFAEISSKIFGPEPAHDWCYYYQKAQYARQMGDWQAIARLADTVMQKDLNPTYPSEWMPFVEGYASVGRDSEAKQLANRLKTMNPDGRIVICQQLKNPPDYPEGYDYQKVQALLCSE